MSKKPAGAGHRRSYSGGNTHLRTQRLNEIDMVSQLYSGAGASQVSSELFGLPGAHAAIYRADRTVHAPDGKVASNARVRMQRAAEGKRLREQQQQQQQQQQQRATLKKNKKEASSKPLSDSNVYDDYDDTTGTDEEELQISTELSVKDFEIEMSKQHQFPLALKARCDANDGNKEQKRTNNSKNDKDEKCSDQVLKSLAVDDAADPKHCNKNEPDEASFFRAWQNHDASFWNIPEQMRDRRPMVVDTGRAESASATASAAPSSSSAAAAAADAPLSSFASSPTNASSSLSSVATGPPPSVSDSTKVQATSPLFQTKRARLGAVDPLRPWHRTASVEDTPFESEFRFNSALTVLEQTAPLQQPKDTENAPDAPAPAEAAVVAKTDAHSLHYASTPLDGERFRFITRRYGSEFFGAVVAKHEPKCLPKGYQENQEVPVAPGTFFDVRQTEYVHRLRGLMAEIFEPQSSSGTGRKQKKAEKAETAAPAAPAPAAAAAASSTTEPFSNDDGSAPAATAASEEEEDEDHCIESCLEQFKDAPQLTASNKFSLARTLRKIRSYAVAAGDDTSNVFTSQEEFRDVIQRALRFAQEITRSGAMPFADVKHDLFALGEDKYGRGGRGVCVGQVKLNFLQCPRDGIHVRLEEDFVKLQLLGLRLVTDPLHVVVKGENAAMCSTTNCVCGLRKKYTILGELSYDKNGKATLHPHPTAESFAKHHFEPSAVAASGAASGAGEHDEDVDGDEEEHRRASTQPQPQLGGASTEENDDTVADRIKSTVAAAMDSASAHGAKEDPPPPRRKERNRKRRQGESGGTKKQVVFSTTTVSAGAEEDDVDEDDDDDDDDDDDEDDVSSPDDADVIEQEQKQQKKQNLHQPEQEKQFHEYDLQLDSNDFSGSVASTTLELDNPARVPEKLDPATEVSLTVKLKQLDVTASVDFRKAWGDGNEAKLVVRDVEVRLRHFSIAVDVKDAPFKTMLAKIVVNALRPMVRQIVEGLLRGALSKYSPTMQASSSDDDDDDDDDELSSISSNDSIIGVNANNVNIVI